MDETTATYEQTVNHIKNCYPLSNTKAQLNIRKAVMEKACNNPNLLMMTCSSRVEKMRLKEEIKQGKQSLKNFIIDKEWAKRVKKNFAQ